MDTAGVAAIVFTFVTVGAVIFQVGLALGAPWGEYAMGGKFPGRFPPPMRIAAFAQALVLMLLAAIVLSRAGLAFGQWRPASSWLVWIVVGFSSVGLVLNAITSSAAERRTWVPVAGLMLISSTIVALGIGQ